MAKFIQNYNTKSQNAISLRGVGREEAAFPQGRRGAGDEGSLGHWDGCKNKALGHPVGRGTGTEKGRKPRGEAGQDSKGSA